MDTRRLGALSRDFSLATLHWSTFAAPRPPIKPPVEVDSYAGMPNDADMLGNDQWGDCVEAACYRIVEIASYDAQGAEVTVKTPTALQLYSDVTGFDLAAGLPGQNATDQGTVPDDAMRYWQSKGIPLSNGNVSKALGWFDIDKRILEDVHCAIWQGGAVMLAIACYEQFLQAPNGGTWYPPQPHHRPVGGHAIACGRYLPGGFWVKSWGMEFWMPSKTFHAVVQSVLLPVIPEWIEKSGMTPLNMTAEQLETAMAALHPQRH